MKKEQDNFYKKRLHENRHFKMKEELEKNKRDKKQKR